MQLVKEKKALGVEIDKKHVAKKSTIRIWLISFIVMFFTCAYITLTYLAPASTLQQVFDSIFAYDANDMYHYVNMTIKVPRILGALIVGGLLAVGGAVMQGITRNFLASPDVVGVSAGANLGLTLAFTVAVGTNTYVSNLLFSMVGAGVSTVLIFMLSSRLKGKEGGIKLLLAGVALGSLFSAVSTAITLWSYTEQGAGIYLWNNSGLLGIRWIGIGVLCLGVVGVIIAFCIAGRLTVLGMGDETAIALGQNVKATKMLGICSVVLISSTTVSVVGNIGFIGLIVPNMVKMSTGEDYRKVIPYSALFGSMLLVIADVVSRLINMPIETPVGLITSVMGIPLFLYFINSRKAKEVF